MLDRAACSQMNLGDARVDLQTLCEFSELLERLGFRSSSERGESAVEEEENGDETSRERTADDAGVRRTGVRRPDKRRAEACREPPGTAAAGGEWGSRKPRGRR